MLVYFVSKQNRYQLGNAGKDQVSMKSLFILGFPPCKAEGIFYMVDRAFYSSSYFIGGIPFRGSPQCAGIEPQVFFRIQVDHPSAGGIRAGVFALALALLLSSSRIFYPFHFRARKFVPNDPTAELAGSFWLHRE